MNHIRVGTAGWSIPRASADHFISDGTHLQRYARLLTCAEINSSFHRPHSAATYAKWAQLTPPGFQFAVKMPRTITHDLALRRARRPVEEFLDQTAGLGEKRGPVLVQLPPSHAFDARVARRFFDLLRSRLDGPVVFEPRHPTWLSAGAEALLVSRGIARVAADPPPMAGAEFPGGWKGMLYYRLHGSPRKYWSRYDRRSLEALTHALRSAPASVEVWCVFDNTAGGAALENARELQALVAPSARR